MKKKLAYFGIIAIIGVVAVFLLVKEPQNSGNDLGVPATPVHWHPKVKIIIKGEELVIPPSIGISVGNNIDNQISGMRMSPTHTHESDGTIHLENNKPWQKPETLTLGYFFKVWGKNFNSSCIFEYCNSENTTLKMIVNGQQNFGFDNYLMYDKDEIIIEYKS